MTFKQLIILVAVVVLWPAASFGGGDPEQRVNHVVFCWLKDSGNQQLRQQIIDASLTLKSIPGVLDIRAGEVVPSERDIVDSSFDVAILIVFKNVEDRDAYIAHPDHVKVADEIIRPLSSNILIYDFLE